MTRIAFLAPLKAPDDPTPSGDREIARLLLRALEAEGHEPFLASRLRTREGAGDGAAQARIRAEAAAEADRLIAELAPDPPGLIFTYHNYWKAPDLIGPVLADRFRIPYLIAEPSHSPRRLHGAWADFATAALAALRRADRLFWMTLRDLPGLQSIAREGQLVPLPPFVEPGPEPVAPPPSSTLRLVTVAMMREGDKRASYVALAAALRHLKGDWQLTVIGDGPARAGVEADFKGLPVTFRGLVTDRAVLRAELERHDLFVWPGVGEGFGMVYLEAQAAGLPALAAAYPGPASLMPPGARLPGPDNLPGFAAAIRSLAARPEARAEARAHVLARHSLDAARAALRTAMAELLP